MANPQTVQAMVVGTYLDLMSKLNDLPADLAEANADLLEAKLRLNKTESRLKDQESAMMLKVAQMLAGERSNAETRQAKATEMLNRDPLYTQESKVADEQRAEVAQLTKRVADLERQYGAVGFQVRLHAGLMNYLGNAGANVHVPEMTFAMGALALTTSAGNGYKHDDAKADATAADAADFGL
jgi:hypothetical protein